MHHWVASLTSYGYPLIFLALLLESLGVPSPDEIILVGSGYLISQGKLSFTLTVVTAVIGSTTGAVLAYSLARLGGRPLIERYGRRLGLGPEKWERAEDWFRRYGEVSVILGRIVSGVRLFISYPAGLFGLRPVPFLLYTVIGSLLWALLAVTVGYYLGPHWGDIFHLVERYALWLMGLALVAVVAYLLLRRYRRPTPPDESL